MKKKITIIIFTLFSTLNGFGAAYNTWWQKANQLYSQKQYDSAAYYFDQIAALKPQEAVVYYNLGNAYYRLNNIPYAVLNYERALRINADYKAAKENLSLTQSRIGNRIQPATDIFFVSWWQSLTQSNKAGTWAVTGLVIFIIMIVCLLARRLRKDAGMIPPQLIGMLSTTWIVFLILAFAATQNKLNNRDAVVMQNDAPLMNNEQKGKPLSLVPAGTTIEIKEEKNNWAAVRLPDGRRGWIQESLLTKI